MTVDNGGGGKVGVGVERGASRRMVEAWWVGGMVGALKLRLMCPLHSPACDLRASDSQKMLKRAGVLMLQPHTC